jgi:hypothetical protein
VPDSNRTEPDQRLPFRLAYFDTSSWEAVAGVSALLPYPWHTMHTRDFLRPILCPPPCIASRFEITATR